MDRCLFAPTIKQPIIPPLTSFRATTRHSEPPPVIPSLRGIWQESDCHAECFAPPYMTC
jgi:hypothetical protein